MNLIQEWSEIPSFRRHAYVYVGLLLLGLAGHTLKGYFPGSQKIEIANTEKVAEVMQMHEMHPVLSNFR